MRKNKCPVCENPSTQTQILMIGLKKRLIQKNSRNDEQYQQIKQDGRNSHIELFSRIIDLITLKEGHDIFSCQHKKILTQIFRKTRCSQSIFKQICQQILNQIAQRNFQLDTLCQQIQMIQQRVIKINKQQKTKQNKRRTKINERKPQVKPNKASEGQKCESGQIRQQKQQRVEDIVKDEEQGQQEQLLIQNLVSGNVVIFPIVFKDFNN